MPVIAPQVLQGVGAGVNALTNIAGLIMNAKLRKQQNKSLDELGKEDPTYQANAEAGKRLGYAQNALGSRMAGAGAYEANIQRGSADVQQGIERGATDPNQVLMGGLVNQSNVSDAYRSFAQNEAADKAQKEQNYFAAQQAKIAEDKDVYADTLRRYGNKVERVGSQFKNRQANVSDLTKFGSGLGSMIAGFGTKTA